MECAALLARDHHYLEAQQILTTLGDDPNALDLMARVHVQNGHIDDAKDCWKRVLVEHSQSPEATEGLLALQKLKPRFSLRYRMEALGTVVFVVLALGVFSIGAAWQLRHSSKLFHPVPQQHTRLQPSPLRVSEQVEHFSAPLFLSGTRLSIQGQQLLFDLGSESRVKSAERIEITGQADGLRLRRKSIYRSNQELALARAETASRILASAGCDVRKMFLQTDVTSHSPVADPNARTVLIRTISAQQPKN
jgi:hypothetical protein